MIDCALIGCGYWGSKLRKYIQDNKNFNLKYICNSKSNLNEVWHDKKIKAVVVATPNDLHYPIVKAALSHGKNVLSEKPLALKTVQCKELGQLATENKLLLLVEYTFTFSKALEQAQNLVRNGEIGKILGLEMINRHLGRFGGGSVYWLLGSHMLSVLDMFIPLGKMTFTRHDLVTYNNAVETGVIAFQKGDIAGQIVVGLNYPGKESKVIIYGENGTVIYDAVSQPALVVERYQRLTWKVASELPRERKEYNIDESHNLRYAIEYYYEALQGKVKGNVERAINVTRILEAIDTK